MKKIIILLVGVAMLTACHESLEERAEREAKEFTEKNCPTPVRENTRTDSLTYDKESRTIGYWYTLCGQADNAEAIEGAKGFYTNESLQGCRFRNQVCLSFREESSTGIVRCCFLGKRLLIPSTAHFILMKFLQQHISF